MPVDSQSAADCLSARRFPCSAPGVRQETRDRRQESVGLTEASAWRDVGAESGRSGARRHLQGLAVQVDQLHQGIPAAMVRPEQRPAVLLQVNTFT
ncbi:hypothetical protein AMELA_G00271220 [Ameiurus melas]|uniref:Uncharacterized protein n=1 Tax=Ameiurus melas TaxID=219545 RepID=A0A7J5ZLD3_AMEME|nr:hypothetical protein AMELA_G00271220 [Ameiurus melas]